MHEQILIRQAEYQRKLMLLEYFSGAAPYTEDELQMAHHFGGPQAATLSKHAIALQRKTKFIEILNSETPINEQEQVISNLFQGPNRDIFIQQALKMHRLGKLQQFIAGQDISTDTT